jgi:hypothetical protein
MKRFQLLVAASVMTWTVQAWADVPVNGPVQSESETQTPETATSLYNAATPFRLLDPSRLTMNHSYSLSYFSGPAGGQSVGMYMNSIGYQIAKPLYIQFDLGIMHNPGALVGSGNATAGARILPNFMLRYNPSPKFNLIVDVRTMPTYNMSYPGYVPGYGSSMWLR